MALDGARLFHVNVNCSNLERSRRFYTEVLGGKVHSAGQNFNRLRAMPRPRSYKQTGASSAVREGHPQPTRSHG